MATVNEYEFYLRKKAAPEEMGWGELQDPSPDPSSIKHTHNGSANAALPAGWNIAALNTITGNTLIANSATNALEILIGGVFCVSAGSHFISSAGKEFYAGIKVTMDRGSVLTDLTHKNTLRIGGQTTQTIESVMSPIMIMPVRLQIGDRIELWEYTSATALTKDYEAERELNLIYIGP